MAQNSNCQSDQASGSQILRYKLSIFKKYFCYLIFSATGHETWKSQLVVCQDMGAQLK